MDMLAVMISVLTIYSDVTDSVLMVAFEELKVLEMDKLVENRPEVEMAEVAVILVAFMIVRLESPITVRLSTIRLGDSI